MKKPARRGKCRMFHVDFDKGGAEVVVVPHGATLEIVHRPGSLSLLVRLRGRHIALIPNVLGFREMGQLVSQPTTDNFSRKADDPTGEEKPSFLHSSSRIQPGSVDWSKW